MDIPKELEQYHPTEIILSNRVVFKRELRRIWRSNSYHKHAKRYSLEKKQWSKEKREIQNKWRRNWYQKNKEQERCRQREWAKENPEKRKACYKSTYQKNKENYLANSRRWKKENREKVLKFDRNSKSKQKYGEYWEAHRELLKLQSLINERMKDG